MEKKVELLAPAGNFQCFMAAIQAGADAVYLGGSQYGARAYADNFTEEEIVKAIKLAHLFQRKVYLTVNTLVKEEELKGLVSYMTPFYEAGLDGVIIQDFGVFFTLKEHFPGMELHASTQMTLTGQYGAAFLKEQGASRIVPARELTLAEIKAIKQEAPIEIEAFIHGAMCYAYSGQCLYSSILGGRSGNRGRCAGPCRLPFTSDGKEVYPLSLKDMYTLPHIAELIEAGIDSFKIEGRMKSPEYVAGVTSVYRKYIDLYYAALESGKDTKIQVSKSDERIVKGLYMRTGLHEGYYFKHNGKEMVTLQGGSYAGTNEDVLMQIQKQYIDKKPALPVVCEAAFHVGEPAKMVIKSGESDELSVTVHYDASVCVEGDLVQQAQKRPLSREDILKQLQKSGDTYFYATQIHIDMDEDIFMPVKSLNELRRKAYAAYEKELLQASLRTAPADCVQTVSSDTDADISYEGISVLVSTGEQLSWICKRRDIPRVYIPVDLLTGHASNQNNVPSQADLLKQLEEMKAATAKTLGTCEIMLALPYILRKRSYSYLHTYQELLEQKTSQGAALFDGVLVRNLEELKWLKDMAYTGQMIADANIYIFNQKTKSFFANLFSMLTVPVELNRKERKQLGISDMESVVYGRIPMMYTANCTKKTLSQCDGTSSFDTLTDRHRNAVPVYHNCKHCYNIIYNSVPLSLHQYLPDLQKDNVRCFRMEFTTERGKDMEELIDFYQGILREKDTLQQKKLMQPGSYTTGHYKRGVE